MERRRQTSVEQMQLLVNYLEQHQDLALGRVRSKEARATAARLWRECGEILNAEGPARTGKEWAKVWNDLKCRVRAKLVSINANQQATGGGPSTAAVLSPLEERIANILGRDIGPLPNVRQDPFVSQDHTEGTHEEEITDHVHEEAMTDHDTEFLELQMDNVVPETTTTTAVLESPTPSITGQVPSPSALLDTNTIRRDRQRTRRVMTARRAALVNHPPPPAQSNRTALDESRSMVLNIETMRAEAALKNAEAMRTVAEGFKFLAESLDRFTKEYSSSHSHRQEHPGPTDRPGN